MKIINKPRRTGKTTQLIYTSATTGFPIIVSNKDQARNVSHLAEEMKINIPTPMTVAEYRGSRPLPSKTVLIDEGIDIIEAALSLYLGNNTIVSAITMTTPDLEKYLPSEVGKDKNNDRG